MELRVLKYFLMVAREESITKAAERLHITQPTLSRQMADLEKEMGVPLLDRSGRRIGLTPEGMLLRRRAEEIISLVDKTEMEVTQAQENLEGTINIAGGDLAATRDFVKLIKEFHELHPHVDFQYYTDITPYICECIDHGCVDIGLLVQPFDVEKYNFLALGEEKAFGVYMRSDDPLAEKDEVTIEDLKGKPLIQTIREDWYAQFSGSSEYLNDTKALIRVTLQTTRPSWWMKASAISLPATESFPSWTRVAFVSAPSRRLANTPRLPWPGEETNPFPALPRPFWIS